MKNLKSCLIVFLVGFTLAKADYGVKLYSVRFFEGGYHAPTRSLRRYTKQFAKNSTRYVWCELKVTNLLYNRRQQTRKVIWRYYKPNNQLFCTVSADFVIKREWATAWIPHGWGWRQPGKWAIGNYRVTVSIDGKKIGSGYFSICQKNISSTYQRSNYSYNRRKTLEFTTLQLFNSDYSTVPNSKTYYTTSFQQSTLCYVGFLLKAKNLLWRVREQKPNIVVKYYNAMGSYLGQSVVNIKVPSSWKSADFWGGWGWRTPSKWKAGNYSIKAYIDGVYVKTLNFYITNSASAYRQAKRNTFPQPQKLQKIYGRLAQWEIKNNSAYSISISYSGASTGFAFVSPYQTKSVTLKSGFYKVNGHSYKPGVIPYSGSISLQAGWKYRNIFYIRSR